MECFLWNFFVSVSIEISSVLVTRVLSRNLSKHAKILCKLVQNHFQVWRKIEIKAIAIFLRHTQTQKEKGKCKAFYVIRKCKKKKGNRKALCVTSKCNKRVGMTSVGTYILMLKIFLPLIQLFRC